LAHNRQTIRYSGISHIVGFEGAGVWAPILGRIMHWCANRGLPPLASLVVNDSGEPGSGAKLEEAAREREHVYTYPWFTILPPTINELARTLTEPGTGPQRPDRESASDLGRAHPHSQRRNA
jgi:hypothetical protein